MKRTLFIVSLLLVQSAWAAKPSKPKVRPVPKVTPAMTEVPYSLSDEEYNKLLKEVKRSAGRKIAADAVEFSPEFQAFRREFLAINRAEEIDPKILGLFQDAVAADTVSPTNRTFGDPKFDAYPNDLKLAAALLRMVPVYKGFLYRIRPLVEYPKVLHSMLLTIAQGQIWGSTVFFPTPQMDAAINYVTQPWDGMKPRITNVGEFQNFISTEVIPHATALSARLQHLARNLQRPIPWDNQLVYGTASFVDDVDRYRMIGKPELYLMISMIETALAQAYLAVAYDLTGTLQIAEGIGRLYGVDGFNSVFWGSTVQGAPSRDRAAVINGERNFLKLVRRDMMNPAWEHTRLSIQYGTLAWDQLKDKPHDDLAGLNPAVANAFSRQMSLGRTNLLALLRGPASFKSQVTGEVVTVNIRKFFTDPPADLKVFLPNRFKEGDVELRKTVDGRRVRYRDFLIGSPTGWQVSEYAKYFPDVKTNEDVKMVTRVMAQSFAGSGIAFALGAFGF